MLVLSRKVGERIVIGETISLTVVEVKGGRIRLGIQAPRNVAILRQELSQLRESQSKGSSNSAESCESVVVRPTQTH